MLPMIDTRLTLGLLAALGLLCLPPAHAAQAAQAAQAADAADAKDGPANAEDAAVASPAAVAASPTGAASAPGRPASSRPAGATAAAQRVEITATQVPDSNEDRRRSTASRITFGREELDRMGDSSLGEVLKRLPGVSIGGTPGRGGAVRMRGMGGGYTQILIDGQRMAPGFSLDSIAPEQIERIEVMRAPVAEHSTQAIAGTINVIMRSDFKRKTHEFRVGGGADGGRSQVGASWINNGQTDLLGYNVTVTAFQGGQGNESDTQTRFADAADHTTLGRQEHANSESRRQGLFANGRLQFKLGPGQTLDLQPFFNSVQTHTTGQATLTQTLPQALPANDPAIPYRQADWQTDSHWQMARINSTYIAGSPAGGRLQFNVNGSLSESGSLSDRLETGGSAGAGRRKVDDSRARELSVDFKSRYSQLLAERHSASGGLDLARSLRKDGRTSTTDNKPVDAEFGEDIQATTQRIALWAQDEWDWSKTFSFYAGARWEAITTRSDAVSGGVHQRSAVFTPLAQMVWKLPDAPRDQIRASLTRSYRAPSTGQLIARLTRANLAPDLGKTNDPINPDRGGNPNLLPELAWGLEVGAEHYLDAGGIVSANLFLRKIDKLIRQVRSLEPATDTTAPRWVSRPQNIGQADVAGLELEAKGRLSDLMATALPVTLRGNLTLMWSQVDQVTGPHNRIEGQAPYTANLGADWPLKGTPLTLGANLNFTPGFQIAQIDHQVARQGVKRVLDGNAVWRFSPDASLRLTVSNAGARRYDTGSTLLLVDANGLPAGSQASDTANRSYTTLNLRGEFRF